MKIKKIFRNIEIHSDHPIQTRRSNLEKKKKSKEKKSPIMNFSILVDVRMKLKGKKLDKDM